jgi:hypothetical protein
MSGWGRKRQKKNNNTKSGKVRREKNTQREIEEEDIVYTPLFSLHFFLLSYFPLTCLLFFFLSLIPNHPTQTFIHSSLSPPEKKPKRANERVIETKQKRRKR